MARIFAISDIHGFFDEFETLRSYVRLSITEDILISCGDMIDRGPKGREVVEWFKRMQGPTKGRVQALFGNHEHLLLSYISGNIKKSDYTYTVYGGSFTLDSYKGKELHLERHSEYIASLPFVLSLGDLVFCHAKINPLKTLEKQTAYDTLWDYKKDFYLNESYCNDDKIYIFGHTPTYYINKDIETKRNNKNYEDHYECIRINNKICIDCSYYKEKKLVMYDITNNIFHYYDFNTKKCYTKDKIKTF